MESNQGAQEESDSYMLNYAMSCLDSIEHWIDSRHIAVYHKGRWFKVYCYKNAQLLSPKDLEQVLEMILLDTSPPCDGEEQLAALTAGDRVPWAEVGASYFE